MLVKNRDSSLAKIISQGSCSVESLQDDIRRGPRITPAFICVSNEYLVMTILRDIHTLQAWGDRGA